MQIPIFSLSNLARSLRQNRMRSTHQKNQTSHSPHPLLTPLIVGVSLLFFSCSDKTELGIEGKVLGEDGQAISGANVAISGPESHSAATDSAGKFLFGDIVAGSYEITVNKSGYKPYSNRVTVVDTVATADAVLEKEDAQTISGTVLNKETNKPVSNVQLTTVPVTISVTSDNNGVYQFAQKLDPGNYVVTALAEGFETAKVEVSVQPGEPARVDILIQPLQPVLALSETGLDFGQDKNSIVLTIKNEGTGTLNWSVAVPKEQWIKLEKLKGTSTRDVPDTLEIEIKREGLEPKPHELDLAFTSNGGTKKITVTINVEEAPALFVEPETVTFGLDKATLEITIENRGTGALKWQINTPENWITVDKIKGETRKTPTVVKLTANRLGKKPGSHKQVLTITSNGGKMDVGVSMEVSEKPEIEVSEKALDFGSDKTSLDITIKNVGTGQINWRIAVPEGWLIPTLTDGIATTTKSSVVNLSVERRGRNPDKYKQEVTISSNGGDQVVSVTMLVDRPTMEVDNRSLPFDPKTDQKSFKLSRQGFSTIDFEIESNKKWLQVKPQAGKLGDDPVTVNASVVRTSLPQGKSEAILKITSKQAVEILEIQVSVKVLPTFRLQVLNAKTEKPIAQASTMGQKTTHSGVIEIRNTDLATQKGQVEAKGYLDQSFSVRLTNTSKQIVEHTVRLTPIPEKKATIQSRDIDLPTEIALSGDGIFAYVINSETASATKIQVGADQVVRSIDLSADGRDPKDVIVHPTKGDIYVANSFVKPIKLGGIQKDSVSVIAENFNRSNAIEVGNHPSGLAIDPITNQLYVSNRDAKTISVVDLDQQKEIGLIPLNGECNRMVLTHNDLYVIADNSIVVIDTRLKRVLKTIKKVFMPTDLAASTDQRFVYVANSQTDSIGVIDVKTRSIVKELTVGAIPIRVAVTKGFRPQSDLIFVVNQGAATITMIESHQGTWQVSKEQDWIKVGFMPLGIAATQDKVYVVLQEDSIIEVLEF